MSEQNSPANSLSRASDDATDLDFRAPGRSCKHECVMPTFNEAAASGLDAHVVRQRWPRFYGECPACNQQVILYASYEHFYYGDW